MFVNPRFTNRLFLRLAALVYPETRSVSEAVEAAFGFAEMQVVSFADLYAGKLVATLDWQHPRDLFDVRDLLANEGINDELRKAFIVHIISHNRPMAEVLAPTRRDISLEFERGLEGMTDTPVSLDDLLQGREDLIAELVGRMPGEHRKFLASFKRGRPEWELLGIPHVENLPAVQWKIQNLAAMDLQFRAVLRDTSPHVWRRLLIPSDLAINGHRSKAAVVPDPARITLADLSLYDKESFHYDGEQRGFHRPWRLEFRLEKRLPIEGNEHYPRCIGGSGADVPGECGGTIAYECFRDLFTPEYVDWRLAEMRKEGSKPDHAKELAPLDAWMNRKYSRRQINRRLQEVRP